MSQSGTYDLIFPQRSWLFGSGSPAEIRLFGSGSPVEILAVWKKKTQRCKDAKAQGGPKTSSKSKWADGATRLRLESKR
jgi:hypothetical protein